jgi:hypothetical protein
MQGKKTEERNKKEGVNRDWRLRVLCGSKNLVGKMTQQCEGEIQFGVHIFPNAFFAI